MEEAEEKNDKKALDALFPKLDSLERFRVRSPAARLCPDGDGQTTDQGSQDEQCESQRSRIGLFSPRAVSVSIKVVPCRARDTKLREQFLPPYALTESAARHAVQMVVTRRRLNEEQIGRVGEVGLFLVSDRILPSEWQSLPRRDPKPACERLPPIRAPQTRATRWLETAKK
jgi:hypothetical protein